jgi:hypothetical protein
LQSFCNCLQLFLGGASSSANSCKNPCYGRTRPEVVAGLMMQIYQNTGRARLAERAGLVLEYPCLQSVVNPLFWLSYELHLSDSCLRPTELMITISLHFKLHMCSLKSKMCSLKKMHNRLESS